MQSLLNKTAQDRRDAQLSHPAARLRHLQPSYRRRPVAAIRQCLLDARSVLAEVRTRRVGCRAADTRRSLVRLHSS